ncbi:MAG: alpha/beta hydrolase family protein [Prolixibacteraceae bacterium]
MKYSAVIVLFLISLGLSAQVSVKKSLHIEDFAKWKTISNSIVSNNGDYVAFGLNPQKGDGNLIVNHKNSYDTIPRGGKAQFSPESNYVVFEIEQPEDTIRQAKLNEVKKDKMPKDSLGIFFFRHKEIFKFPKLESFRIPEENARWIAFTTELPEAENDFIKKKKKDNPGDNLVLFDTDSKDTVSFKNVTEYHYAKKGSAVYFVRQLKDSAKTSSSLHVFDTRAGTENELYFTEGWIKKIVSDESGGKYAFLMSQDTVDEKTYALYYGAYQSETEPKDTLLDEEKPKLDIWHWQDKQLQPEQELQVDSEKKRTYLAVYHLDLKRFIQLANPEIKNIRTIQKGNADIGLGYDFIPYTRSSSWTGQRYFDAYLVDFKSGIKRKMVDKKSQVWLSPQGKYVLWYEPADSNYYSKSSDISKPEINSLTKLIPVGFYNEDFDRPTDPQPYGIAGWSEDDNFVFIYDRYDIWKIDPAGKRVPVNISKAFGRRNKTRLRYVKLDEKLEFIPSDEEILLKAFDERTKSNGFFSTKLKAVQDPKLLIMDKFYFGTPKKANNDNKIIWTKENVKIFPDLWMSNLDFKHSDKISNANPQQKEYIWPTSELVKWTSFSGEELEGIFIKPEDFDPNKKYPVLIYFYEKNAENLYRHRRPSPSRSVINPTFYSSNGYLIFIPDITYKEGYPGESAYNAIVSGTQYLINTFPSVDKERIGIQGQSWGGYQVAYLITQTDLYAAAMAGAPVSNMTSAYGGIRWGSGMSRMFQYERTQSRIGGTLWERPLQYIENSPLFYAPKVQTPLMMMHNDGDGAVPWYQGIEFFVALRRLDKPVWLLTYNGEPHNLKSSSWANRVDLSKRMFQFFNHYLKGKPMPEWMEKGIPALEKGKTLGY